MSYQKEREAIETYFLAEWADRTPVIPDGQSGNPVNDSIRLTIQSGAAMQGSIGRTLNRINHVGTVTVTIYTEGGKGSAAWRGHAEAITGIFFEKTIDQSGAIITQSADTFVRFSPPELSDNRHPYIAASFADAPFHHTNVIAPFVRHSYR